MTNADAWIVADGDRSHRHARPVESDRGVLDVGAVATAGVPPRPVLDPSFRTFSPGRFGSDRIQARPDADAGGSGACPHRQSRFQAVIGRGAASLAPAIKDQA